MALMTRSALSTVRGDSEPMRSDRYTLRGIVFTRKVSRSNDALDVPRGILLAVLVGAVAWAAMGMLVWALI
jgi:hypothetical protein